MAECGLVLVAVLVRFLSQNPYCVPTSLVQKLNGTGKKATILITEFLDILYFKYISLATLENLTVCSFYSSNNTARSLYISLFCFVGGLYKSAVYHV